MKPRVSSLVPIFGSNRMLASEYARELEGCSWVGVVFAGGMSEVAHLTARTLQVNDKHPHIINLAIVCADRVMGPILYRRLRRRMFHPDDLYRAQQICAAIESQINSDDRGLFADGKICRSSDGDLDWAEAYFISAWMIRHGTCGLRGEFNAGISTRWSATGGDQAAHYWGAVHSLMTWRRILRRANFTTLDFADFLDKCKDEPGIGLYSDAPFPGPGDKYAHTFGIERQRELAERLVAYRNARVVIRFYDVPLIRELYPEAHWNWRELVGRKQTNAPGPEVLITNKTGFPVTEAA